MQSAKRHIHPMLADADREPRLVARKDAANGNLVEVFEIDGQHVVVESWNVEHAEQVS
jgi:hypothetical protein